MFSIFLNTFFSLDVSHIQIKNEALLVVKDYYKITLFLRDEIRKKSGILFIFMIIIPNFAVLTAICSY